MLSCFQTARTETDDRKRSDHLAGRSAGQEERIRRRPEQVRNVRSGIQPGAVHEPLAESDGRAGVQFPRPQPVQEPLRLHRETGRGREFRRSPKNEFYCPHPSHATDRVVEVKKKLFKHDRRRTTMRRRLFVKIPLLKIYRLLDAIQIVR